MKEATCGPREMYGGHKGSCPPSFSPAGHSSWQPGTAALGFWEQPAEGGGQPQTRTVGFLQIRQVIATCNSYSSGFSVLPVSRCALIPLTLALLTMYFYCIWVVQTSQTHNSNCTNLESGILCKSFQKINLRCLQTLAFPRSEECCLFKSTLWALVGPYLTLLRDGFYADHLWHSGFGADPSFAADCLEKWVLAASVVWVVQHSTI